jgi:hypothetical protein
MGRYREVVKRSGRDESIQVVIHLLVHGSNARNLSV